VSAHAVANSLLASHHMRLQRCELKQSI